MAEWKDRSCPECGSAMGVSRKRGLWVCRDIDCGCTEPLDQDPAAPIAPMPPGREHEVSRLLHAAESARKGRTTLVLLEGEAGAGKSTLVRFLYEHYARGSNDPEDYWPDVVTDYQSLAAPEVRARWKEHVPPWLWLIGHCISAEQIHDPLQPWKDVVRQLDCHELRATARSERVRSLGKLAVEAGIEAAIEFTGVGALKTIASLGKKLVDTLRQKGATQVECDQALLKELKRQIAHVISAVARSDEGSEEGGTFSIVVLDDLHWATRQTLELLLQLLRQGGRRKLMILGTLRPVDARSHKQGLQEALTQVERYAGEEYALQRIALGRLPTEVSARVVRERLPLAEDPLCSWIAEVTHGNPLFVIEFCRLLVDRSSVLPNGKFSPGSSLETLRREVEQGRLPSRVEAVVTERFDRLEASQRRLLEYASVSGRVFHERYLQDVRRRADRDEGDVDALRRELADLEKIHELILEAGTAQGGFAYEFAHALFVAAARQSLSAPLRRSCLEALAQFLWAQLSDDNAPEGDEAVQIGRQLVAAINDAGLAERDPDWRRHLARTYTVLAEASAGFEDYSTRLEWVNSAQRALGKSSGVADTEHRLRLAEALVVHSDLLAECGRDEEALLAAQKALQQTRTALQRDTSRVGALLVHLRAVAAVADRSSMDVQELIDEAVREASPLLHRWSDPRDAAKFLHAYTDLLFVGVRLVSGQRRRFGDEALAVLREHAEAEDDFSAWLSYTDGLDLILQIEIGDAEDLSEDGSLHLADLDRLQPLQKELERALGQMEERATQNRGHAEQVGLRSFATRKARLRLIGVLEPEKEIAEAESLALDVEEFVGRFPTRQHLLSLAYWAVAEVLARSVEPHSACTWIDKFVEAAREQANPEAGLPGQQYLVEALIRASEARINVEDAANAVSLADEAVERSRSLLDEYDSPYVVESHAELCNQVGGVLIRAAKHRRAVAILEECLRHQRNLVDRGRPDLAGLVVEPHCRLAQAHEGLGDRDACVGSLRRGLASIQARLDAKSESWSDLDAQCEALEALGRLSREILRHATLPQTIEVAEQAGHLVIRLCGAQREAGDSPSFVTGVSVLLSIGQSAQDKQVRTRWLEEGRDLAVEAMAALEPSSLEYFVYANTLIYEMSHDPERRQAVAAILDDLELPWKEADDEDEEASSDADAAEEEEEEEEEKEEELSGESDNEEFLEGDAPTAYYLRAIHLLKRACDSDSSDQSEDTEEHVSEIIERALEDLVQAAVVRNYESSPGEDSIGTKALYRNVLDRLQWVVEWSESRKEDEELQTTTIGLEVVDRMWEHWLDHVAVRSVEKDRDTYTARDLREMAKFYEYPKLPALVRRFEEPEDGE